MKTTLFVCGLAALALAGCGGTTTTIIGAPGDQRASVSVWNLLAVRSGNVPDVQAIINGQDCGKNTPYLNATINDTLKWFASAPNLAVRTAVAGTATRLVAEDKIFLNNEGYTMTQVGVPGETADPFKPTMLYFVQDKTRPAATQIRVRFVHAAPSGANIDLWLGRTGSEVKVASNLAYKGSPTPVTITLPTTAQGLTLIGTPVGVAPKPSTNIFTSGNITGLVTGGKAYFVPIVFSAGRVGDRLNFQLGTER